MSGIVTGVDYSVLFAGSTSLLSRANATSPLLAALYASGAAGAASGGDPLAALTLAQKNETRDVAAEAKTPTVARDLAAFQKGIANAKTIQDALLNPDVLKVLLTANNLASQLAYPALAQKALMSNPNDTKSLAYQISGTNSTWLAVAKTYDFFKNGLSALKDPKIQASLTNAYAEISWQKSLDAATPGLANALQFIKQAGSIANVDNILGDPVNRAVVLTAFNIPPQIAFQSLSAQEDAVSSRLDIKQLKDPKFVTSLTDQYLLNMQQQQASSPSSAPSLDALAVQMRGLVV
jgi:Protein of unknown function (DUF1217)